MKPMRMEKKVKKAIQNKGFFERFIFSDKLSKKISRKKTDI